MDAIEKKVTLTLHITIDDDSQIETNTTKQTGLLYQRSNMDVLTYHEKMEDGSVMKNMMTLQTDKVSIKRTGPVSMHQKFDPDQVTENVYRHPHGHLHMETTTDSIVYKPLGQQSDGLLEMTYTVKLNGQDERKHTLTLSLKEEAPL
ncbi:MAG TPA: DUF1934 domain-containing protein [Bacillota bacterium]|nr:DUF1934 domain-containing protein [Bacillota bacterium]